MRFMSLGAGVVTAGAMSASPAAGAWLQLARTTRPASKGNGRRIVIGGTKSEAERRGRKIEPRRRGRNLARGRPSSVASWLREAHDARLELQLARVLLEQQRGARRRLRGHPVDRRLRLGDDGGAAQESRPELRTGGR